MCFVCSVANILLTNQRLIVYQLHSISQFVFTEFKGKIFKKSKLSPTSWNKQNLLYPTNKTTLEKSVDSTRHMVETISGVRYKSAHGKWLPI